MHSHYTLPCTFYARDPRDVARDLLGKILVRRLGAIYLKVMITETEAYYGPDDPASRAYGGRRTKLTEVMWGPPGRTLIYMVHGGWLLNIVTEPEGTPSAVLIRAGEPLTGINLMKRFRKETDLYNLTTGPAKLTQALKITKKHHNIDICDETSDLFIVDSDYKPIILTSKRIGVKGDLPIDMRFYIKDSRFVSR